MRWSPKILKSRTGNPRSKPWLSHIYWKESGTMCTNWNEDNGQCDIYQLAIWQLDNNPWRNLRLPMRKQIIDVKKESERRKVRRMYVYQVEWPRKIWSGRDIRVCRSCRNRDLLLLTVIETVQRKRYKKNCASRLCLSAPTPTPVHYDMFLDLSTRIFGCIHGFRATVQRERARNTDSHIVRAKPHSVSIWIYWNKYKVTHIRK